MRNRKGITELVLMYTVIAFLGGIFLWKPVTSALGLSTPKTVNQSSIKKEEKKPVIYVIDDKGEVHIGYATSSSIETNSKSSETQLTFFQKIKNLGFIGIILVILGFLFPPVGAVLLFVWNKVTSVLKKKLDDSEIAHDALSYDAKKIVQSIDEGLAVIDTAIASAKTPEIQVTITQLKKDFLTAMSRKQDTTTKLLVSELKND